MASADYLGVCDAEVGMTSIVTVRTYSTYAEAMVAKSYLDAHGVCVFLPDWHLATNAWHLTTALQGVRLCAVASEAAAVCELLSAVRNEEASQGQLPISEVVLAAAVYLFCGIPHPVRRR